MERNNDILAVIPKKRGKSAQRTILLQALFSLLVGCSFVNERFKYIFLVLASSMYCIIICLKEVCVRVGLLREEWKHLETRYDNDWWLLIQNAFCFSKEATAVGITTSMYLLSIYFQNLDPFELLQGFGIYANLCAAFAALLISAIIELDHGPLYQAIMLEKLCGLDYGASMAYSYFHGFLQIVLPNKGNEQKGIQELMRDFESNERVHFAHQRLIVLIPMSLYCPPNLEDHSKIIDLAQSLGEIKLSRGGVHQRIYKNTAYKILTPTHRLYVCAEYATPLRTLHEIISNNNEHANIYKKHKNELIVQFYLTLKDILDNSPECRNLCDLVLFNDKKPNNEFEDVGRVILNHLNQVNSNRL